MSYSRNMPDWQQYNALQSGGSEAAKSGQNISSSHLYVSNISPPSHNGLNLSSDCLSKSQNDVINYSQRNYQPPNNTPSGPNNLVEPSLTSLVHMSSCVGHYGASSSMNSIMDDSSNVDLRNGSVAALNEEMAHRNQISLNGPVPRVVGPNMNVGNNMGTAGSRIPPANTVPSNRQGPYMSPCKGPCCVSDPNVNYQAWDKFSPYQTNNPYRENLRASGYANETRRYRNDVAYRKDSYTSKDLIPPNSYHVDQRRNFTDYKYCKDPPVPRNYQPSTVLPNYPIQNYSVPSDYQKYAYNMKDYPRQGAVNSQNSGILKYSEHNVAMQDKYPPKQGQYQSGALLQKGLVVPSISSNISSVQNPYLNPQFSRDYQWENHEKDSSKIQNPVPMHSTYPKYQMYQQKYAMQRFSMENHLRELSRIPGYQSHPKYQECILRYRELLRLQQTVDYQSAIQNTLTSANSSVPPINLQFDQNGVLINSNYLPGNFPTSHNPTNSVPNSMNLEKERVPSEESHDLQQLQHLPTRSEQGGATVQNPESVPREMQFLNQKTIENPHCQVAQREEERFEALNSREEENKNSKNFTNKPVLDVRQFLANWDEAEEEEGANANLPDVVLSNSTPIVVVEYGNVGLVAHDSENAAEQKTENESNIKSQEFFQKDQTDANLLQDCSNDLNQGVIYANKLNIKCVGEGIDGVPTIHIVENPEEEFIYTEKAEMEVPGGSLPSLTETKECDSSETKETSMSLNYKKLTEKNSDEKLQMNPQDLSILPLSKNNPETESSNLKKQNSFTNEENQTSDDISLPDLTTSECTPISTTLNTPTHSDSEECSDQGVDLTTSTNPIELIQNSPMFTQSPVKMDPYEHLKGENISLKTSQDGLDFDFQANNETVIKSQVLEHKKENSKKIDSSLESNTSEEQSGSKYCQERPISIITSENPVNKESSEFSSNMDVFSTEDQDKWCWNSMSLIPSEENEEPKISTQSVEENGMTKIMKDSPSVTGLNVLESNVEKTNKVDDMWLDVGYMDKGLDLSSETKTTSNEKLYTESDQKIQKKRERAEVSASVTKILKNIKERQNFIPNSMQESNNIKRNPKGINIISEEIFNSTWRQNTHNKIYPTIRKMSDSFERQEIEAFAEKLKYSHRSRSKSLEMNTARHRSKSVERVRVEDNEENRLLTEFKNLKRKRSIDHFQEESKLPKLNFEQVKEKGDGVSAKHASDDAFLDQSNQKNRNDETKSNLGESKKKTDSDLEIKFRNSCDSSKPFEAIKIEINVSRSDSKTGNQTTSQPQKCNEPDYNGNQEDPSSCGSVTCSGKNSNCQSLSKAETKVQNQKSCEDLDKMNFEKVAEKSKIQGHERKESVIEYFGKGQHKKISKLGYSACDTCKSMNFHKIDKDYICNHHDNRISKSHESSECLMNSLELGNSKIECLSNRLKSISKSRSVEDVKKKSKSHDIKNSRKLKLKGCDNFSGFENNTADKMDINDGLEMLAGTSDSSGFRNSQTNDLLQDDSSDKSEDAKHFVIKNSLHCDGSNFDEIPFKISEDNRPNLKSNLLDCENSLSPKGYLNPLFNSLDDMENLNTVPVYTTKDGKITYSPNPRFTYRTLLMEAREKECQSQFDKSSNYSSTSQDKRSSKSSEKRAFTNKYQTDLKPPKKSLAKRFATQELEKSYQRYLSHRERKANISSNEPMLIKTIKNYSALNESTSGNEDLDEKLNRNSNTDFDDMHLEIEREIRRDCLEEKINQDKPKISDAISLVGESSEENQIESRNNEVFTEIQSPSQGDVEDNQVVPVASSEKDSLIGSENVAKINSTSHSIVEENMQGHLDSVENSFGISEVDQIQNCSVDFHLSDPDSKVESAVEIKSKKVESEAEIKSKKVESEAEIKSKKVESVVEVKSNLEKEIDIQDSNKDTSIKSKLEFIKSTLNIELNNLPKRRQSTSDIKFQSLKPILERRRSADSFLNSMAKKSNFLEKSTSSEDSVSTSSLKDSSEDKPSDTVENLSTLENTESIKNIEAENVEIEKDIEIAENIVKINTSESVSSDKEEEVETIHKDIPIINIEVEEREIECFEKPESSSPKKRKEDEIEVIEIDDDEVFIVEPKQEISQDSEIVDKVDENQEIVGEKIEPNSEELKSPDNQIEDAKVDTPLDSEQKSLTSTVVVVVVDDDDDDDDDNDDDVEEIVDSVVTVQEVTSNTESLSSEKPDDNCLSNQDNGNQSVLESCKECTNPVNEDEHESDFKREIEILSEMIDRHISKNCIENEIQDLTNDDDDFDKPLNVEHQESKFEYEKNNQEPNQANNQKSNQENNEESNRGNNQEINQKINLDRIETKNQNFESELKDCEREYFETRGLSPSLEMNKSTQIMTDNKSENIKEIAEKDLNEKCTINENKIESDQSEFQADDLPLIIEKDHEKHDSESFYIDDESCFEIDPPVLEIQKEFSDSDILNSPKSSDSNQFNKMPDVTLEENFNSESQLKSAAVEKIVPKLVIRKIEINRNSPVKSKSAESNIETLLYRKVPKMIIRNAKSRPTTPTIEEIPEELPLSHEESNVIKVKIRLDDINKNESYMFSNEENRIPKMKIKLEEKLPKVIVKNLDIRNSQDLQKLVPKVKIKKLKNVHRKNDNTKAINSKSNDSEINDSSPDSMEDLNINSEPVEIITNSSAVESNEAKVRVPKLKIKKDLKSSSVSRKRHTSDVTLTESKRCKRSSRDEAKQDRRMDTTTENSLSSSDCQSISEKVPKVIIKRASPTAEFKCEVSNDKKHISIQEASLQPQVVLQRSWILDCMAKELKHVNIALKLAIAKNGSKASVRGKSNSSKIRWEQFIRSLKKQKELSRSESNSNVLTNKIKQRRKSDVGMRYFETNSRLYKIKACKSARESTVSDTNYLNNRSLYFKDMFSKEIIRNQEYNTIETWKKFDENMNSESKDVLQNSEKLNSSNFADHSGEQNNSQREIKLDDDVEIKCPLLNVEEIDSKTNLSLEVGSSFRSFDENQVTGIKIEESQTVSDIRPEFSSSLKMAHGEHEYLYSEDAIPTQFEFELEIVDSSVDTYDVPMSDIKKFPESIDSVDLENSSNIIETGSTNDSDRLPRLLLPDEDSSCTNNGRDESCDIKDEIPVLNSLINSTDTIQNLLCGSSSTKSSDSISLVQEVMAAKEILRKYLPKCRSESTSSRSRPKTLAEKKQGTGFSLTESENISCSAATETSEHRSSRSHTKYDKKRPKESSSSREKHKSVKTFKVEEDPCEYDQHNTISLRDQKRSSLHSTQIKESNKTKDPDRRAKSSDSSSKCSRSKSDSRSQKSRESSKEARDCDVNKMKSYKIPKISKSKENSGENATEVKAKKEMPILEPEGGVNLDPSLDRDTSLSPPVITNQDDVEILEEESKIFDARGEKGDKVSWKMMKNTQVNLGGTLADAIQNWVFHEKATIKHRRYCVLCERWFPSVIRHRRHLSGYQHRHTELTQRRTIHTLFMLFTGKPCPRLLPADVLRPDCSLGEPTPLQIAVQNVALGYEKAHEKSKRKDEESKE